MLDKIQIGVFMPSISKAWCRNDNCSFHDNIDTVSDSKFQLHAWDSVKNKKVIFCQK